MINEGLNDFLLYARKLIREKKENDIWYLWNPWM
jgi:hypothetical protein